MSDTMRPRRAWWVVWAVYAVAWTTALLTTYPLRVRDAVVPADFAFPTGKVLHVLAYAAFAVLSAWVPAPRPGRWALLGFLSLHAFATEFFQQFVGRTASLADVGLDHAGIALGVALTWKRWRDSVTSSRRPSP